MMVKARIIVHWSGIVVIAVVFLLVVMSIQFCSSRRHIDSQVLFCKGRVRIRVLGGEEEAFLRESVRHKNAFRAQIKSKDYYPKR